VDYSDALGPGRHWNLLTECTLTSTQLCLELSAPLTEKRFYRAWHTNALGARPLLDLTFATEITLTGAVGSSVRIDRINAIGPVDAWVTLATVTLTNSPQLYFDLTAFRQPARLYGCSRCRNAALLRLVDRCLKALCPKPLSQPFWRSLSRGPGNHGRFDKGCDQGGDKV